MVKQPYVLLSGQGAYVFLGAQSTWGGMELGFESEGILCPHRQHGGVQGCSCPCHGKVRLGMDGWMGGWMRGCRCQDLFRVQLGLGKG